MKSLLLTVFTVVLLATVPAFGGNGQLSKQQLEALGLSGMQALSDKEGLKVRGMAATGTTSQSIAIVRVSVRLYDPLADVGVAGVGSADDGDQHAASGPGVSSLTSATILQGNIASSLTTANFSGSTLISAGGFTSGFSTLLPPLP